MAAGKFPTDNTRQHRHVLDRRLPPLLEGMTAAHPPPAACVDLGSGDGPRAVAIAADATDVPQLLADDCVELAICSQVIEHLPDDRLLPPELARLLRPGGRFHVSSVVKGRADWWISRRDGSWRLDSTHRRGYDRTEALVDALAHSGLVVDAVATTPFGFPLADFALRAAAMAGILSPEALTRVFRGRPRLARLARAARVRPPAYWMVEVVGRRLSAGSADGPQPADAAASASAVGR